MPSSGPSLSAPTEHPATHTTGTSSPCGCAANSRPS
ncbi:hypothetical protein MUK60_08105 [Streptomyces sp. LRE541]|nr:hypothetical protein [Streptomyces sp. LRE541]UPZ34036.1 hypothetical protein MUK60_08105 [Streptomyces sp. LRE541]